MKVQNPQDSVSHSPEFLGKIASKVTIGFAISCLLTVALLSKAFADNYQCSQLVEKNGYEICYNYDLKAPLWGKAALTKAQIEAEGFPRKNMRFDPEINIPAEHRSSLDDFKTINTPVPYDRGHTISADDLNHNQAMLRSSFSLVNVTHQAPLANRGIYRYTEILTRKLLANGNGGIIVAGAIYGDTPKRVGKNRIAVPTHLYRVAFTNSGEAHAFLIPNENVDMGNNPAIYRVSLEELEKEAGFIWEMEVNPELKTQ